MKHCKAVEFLSIFRTSSTSTQT